MKIIKLSLVAGLSLAWFSSLNAAGIADIYWYEAKPGKVQEVEALMREGRDIAIASGQTTIVHKQNVGVGCEYRFCGWIFMRVIRKKQSKHIPMLGMFIRKFGKLISGNLNPQMR